MNRNLTHAKICAERALFFVAALDIAMGLQTNGLGLVSVVLGYEWHEEVVLSIISKSTGMLQATHNNFINAHGLPARLGCKDPCERSQWILRAQTSSITFLHVVETLSVLWRHSY